MWVCVAPNTRGTEIAVKKANVRDASRVVCAFLHSPFQRAAALYAFIGVYHGQNHTEENKTFCYAHTIP